MSKNPIYNAATATAYIILVALIFRWGAKMPQHPDTFIAPVAMLSLFTLSAAVMGYLFCYTPLTLFLEGKKKTAVTLFLSTVAVFAVTTVVALFLLFTGAFA
jgi:hypothetical protein